MGTFLEPSELPANTGAALGLTPAQMIEDAEALAFLSAPCLGQSPLTISNPQQAAVKALLRGAIMRWNDAGSGAKQSQTTGPFVDSIDTTVARKGMFWPSEITSLQKICSDGDSGKAFSIDTVGIADIHADICSLRFGATYCSCGADIAGYPLYELDD